MIIAQVAPLWERVPPPAYGGIELVVSHITNELVRRGHQVTLFASGDSQKNGGESEAVFNPKYLKKSLKIIFSRRTRQGKKVIWKFIPCVLKNRRKKNELY